MQMKRMLLGLVSVALLGYGVNAMAQSKVTLKEKPVALIKQNDVWVVPEGATYTYFGYSANGSDYICTSTEPVELRTVTGTTVSIKMNGGMRSVRCYPSSYFVMP